MSKRLGVPFAPLILGAFFISGCGGGGGGGATGAGTPPVVTPTLAPASTNATGKLVDDPTGVPLAGVKVGLAPWTPGAPPIPEGTTAPDGTFSFTAPNGHYLLVIGTDSTSDTIRPTIHDNVTLTGGNQILQAPTLPPIPSITPPPMETNGSYRLMTIDATKELPCFNDFNAARVSNWLPKVVVDEWLTENSREAAAYYASPSFAPGVPWPGNAFGFLTTGQAHIGGGNDCNDDVQVIFAPGNSDIGYSASLQTQWFGGTWFLSNPSNLGSGVGVLEFLRDPRAYTDPSVATWY